MSTSEVKLFSGTARQKSADSILVFGVPFDATESFRRGAADCPARIREYSESIEDYSPLLGRNLSQVNFADLGDLPVGESGVEDMIHSVKNFAAHYRSHLLFMLGGDHLTSYPLICHHAQESENLCIVQIDAHTDLRTEWEGQQLTHCTFMRHAVEQFPSLDLIQVGVRSGSEEEYQYLSKNSRVHSLSLGEVDRLLELVKNRPVYLTLDLDILDPAVCPAVCNPEPGGCSYPELLDFLSKIVPLINCRGLDIVELAHCYDASGRSAVTAAHLTRELLLLVERSNRG